jgi:hypothetical protein
MRQEKGEFSAGYAPYGYDRDPNDKHKLVVNEEVAPIVREIFQRYANGETYISIAKSLNERKILTPSQYLKYRHGITSNRTATFWKIDTVRTIVINQQYTGAIVQHRRSQSLYNGEKQKRVKQADYVVVPNMHEPLVNAEIWDKCQVRICKRREALFDNEHISRKENIFKGRLICGWCGKSITQRSQFDNDLRYYCYSNQENGEITCENVKIMSDLLHDTVLELLKKQIKACTDCLFD